MAVRWLVVAAVAALGLGYCAVQMFEIKPTTVASVRVVNERSLGVGVAYGGCERVAGVVVKETATSVRLMARHRVTSIPFSGCPMFAAQKEVTVTLDRPLAGRTVVDVECEKRRRPDCVLSPKQP